MWLTADSCSDFRKRWEDKEHLGTFIPLCVERMEPDGFSPPPPLLRQQGFTRFLIGRGVGGDTGIMCSGTGHSMYEHVGSG